ncbi:hypothetical protein F5878DRAFT_613031 [Lentinula raphanica]|uniref:Uncharacterized protein n=1 Tax=Lentinula raphanica TaxID=153919 RepID=A0AA38PDB8_9AGAR|nr:hypothetical protein F5878DRAFT_613031 [Lentinula raphanica]
MSDIKLSVGALVVSGWMSFMSFGLVLAFGWQYFLQFYDDKILYKTIVTTCLLLCLGDTIVSGLWCYRWSSTYFGDVTALLATPEEAIATLWFFPTTTFIVQLWFATRIWMISARKNIVLPAVIAVLGSGSWAIALWMFSKLVKHHSTLADDANLVFPVGYAWLGGDIATDACIFAGLAYYTEVRSRKQRRHHILSPTSLFAVTCRMIECNVLPLISQIVLIILYKTNVGFYYILSDMTIAKVYTFSLLISLYTRTPMVEVIPHSTIKNSDPITFTRSTINATAVQVRQDVHVVHDSEPSPISPFDKMEIENESEYEVAKGSLVEDFHDDARRHIGVGELP